MRSTLTLLLCGSLAVALSIQGLAQETQPPGVPDEQAAPPSPIEVEPGPAPVPGALSPRNASYSIDVQLDPEQRTLAGREVITWRNITNASTDELRLHLYYNAWKHSSSTWLQEALRAGEEALVNRPAEDWAWCQISAIRLLGAGASPPIDLTAGMRYIAPDDGNERDQTLLSVPLPAPVAPGQTVNVQVEWRSHVPRTFSRTGAIGDFFFIAQWFPKLAVLRDEGWVSHQFHYGTEFFSDYGSYDVRLQVPTGWIVGATGRERSQEPVGDGTTIHRYVADDVHDFAWTTSPDYLVREARFEHPTLPATDMRLLLQPEHDDQAERYFMATRTALRYYGEWYGPYPYGYITIVDPAWQSGAGGMEYPTLFTGGTRWLSPEGTNQPESVTVHEAGHQFWYGIVGNNEFEHAWLDEGLNTFSDRRALAEVQPRYVVDRFFGGFLPYVHRDIEVSRWTERLPGYRRVAESDVQSDATYLYWPASGSRISYDKTTLWLGTLERHLGWPTLQQILSTFFDRWKFRHPRPDDFIAVANEVSGEDLNWFFDEVYRSAGEFDYGIDGLVSRPAASRGFTTRAGAQEFDDGGEEDAFVTEVVVRRYGEARFPVDVVVTFEDGTIETVRWDGQDRWQAFTFEGSVRASSAAVDPERVLVLDVDYTNNSRTLEPRAGEAATKWSLKWLVWLQDLWLTYAFLL